MKTYPIRMSPVNRERIKAGIKTATRRTNMKWLKVKKGDRLRVLQSGGLMLVATADARVQLVQDMTSEDIRREGIRVQPGDASSPELQIQQIAGRWIELWDSLNEKVGERWIDNPEVVVLEFDVDPASAGFVEVGK